MIRLLLLFLLFATHASADEAAARRLFSSYKTGYQSFDPTVADLYAADAKIENTRRYANGQRRKVVIPTNTYTEAIRKMMPMAKARGDTSTYSDVTYTTQKDGNVLIAGTRFSSLKKSTSPFKLLVGPVEGSWKVLEEITESKP